MALLFKKKTEGGFKLNSNIFDVLQEKGFLRPSQIQSIFQKAKELKKPVEEVLEESGFVSEDNLALSYSILHDIPLIHLSNKLVSEEVLSKIPKDIAEKYQIVPFEEEDGFLKVGVVNPKKVLEDSQILSKISEKNQINPSLYVISKTDFKRILTQYKEGLEEEKIPSVSLTGIEIPDHVLHKLPEAVAKKYKMVVFDFIPDKLLKMAVLNPSDIRIKEILNFIRSRTGLTILEYKTREEDLESTLKGYEKKPKVIKERGEAVERVEPVVTVEKVAKEIPPEEIVPEDVALLIKKDIQDENELGSVVKAGYVPKIVAALINFALVKRATDIHVQPYEKDLLVRYRIDGLLRDILHTPLDLHPAIISRIKILSKLKIDEQRIPQDGRFDLNFHGKEVDIRVSTLPTTHGEKTVLRLLDKSVGIISLEQLGLQGRSFDILIKEIEKPYGVILATGPTGSGKSTTLYAIICRIKNETINIITLEDPVEYEIEGVNQCQVKPEIGFDFASGLRSILRQDPNIMMVGEIRDLETASMVTHSALTGHLVLTTLHTNNAAGALPRLINMGVEPFLITSAMNAIIAQRLVRKICDKCKEEFKMPEGAQEDLKKEIEKMPQGTLEELKIERPFRFYRGKRCPECNNSGYKGRIGIFEVLEMTSKIEDITVKRRPASEILEVATSSGMITMRQDGILKVLQGLTTYDEVLRVTAVD